MDRTAYHLSGTRVACRGGSGPVWAGGPFRNGWRSRGGRNGESARGAAGTVVQHWDRKASARMHTRRSTGQGLPMAPMVQHVRYLTNGEHAAAIVRRGREPI